MNWEAYYAAGKAPDKPSAFCEAVIPLLPEAASVLDLGCGNGARLARMLEANSNITPFGVDRDPARVEHAHSLLTEHSDNIVCGNVFEDEWPWPEDQRFALAVLMPGRLLEAGPVRAAELSRKIEACCDQLLVYAHGDWLAKYHDLQGLALRAGLTLLSSGGDMTASLARFRDFGKEPLEPSSVGADGDGSSPKVRTDGETLYGS